MVARTILAPFIRKNTVIHVSMSFVYIPHTVMETSVAHTCVNGSSMNPSNKRNESAFTALAHLTHAVTPPIVLVCILTGVTHKFVAVDIL